MNREITIKKVGKQKKLTNVCPILFWVHQEVMVGSPRCCRECPSHVKIWVREDGKKFVHCDYGE